MANKSLPYYLLKLGRLTGWLLFVLVLTYLSTGYAMAPQFGFNHLIDSQTALTIHLSLNLVLLGVFAVHASISIYFALKRWGWIKRRTTAPQPRQTTPVE